MIKPQAEFPLMDLYRKYFEITDDTIFALYPDIYTNNELTPDLLIHEGTHLKQQEWFGVQTWVDRFTAEPAFRLEMEVDAYRNQLRTFKDRELRNKARIAFSKTLSSALYGNIINYQDAFNLLKT